MLFILLVSVRDTANRNKKTNKYIHVLSFFRFSMSFYVPVTDRSEIIKGREATILIRETLSQVRIFPSVAIA